MSMTFSSSAASCVCPAAAACFCCSSSTLAITSLGSRRAKRISGVSVTLFPDGYRPKVFTESKSLTVVLSCAAIFCAVSGKYGSNRPAPIEMLSTRLYSTVASLSFFASSFANTHGSVSSIYLLQRLNSAKISVRASATLRSSILTSTLS